MNQAWDEVSKAITVAFFAVSAQVMSTVHDLLSVTSLLFASILGGHGVYKIWKERTKK